MARTYGKEMVGRQPIEDQSEIPDFAQGPSVVKMSRNPSVTFCKVWLRGHPVPYIEVFKVPVDDDGNQVYPISENSDGTVTVHPHIGRYRWELTLDHRWAYDFDTEQEAARAAEMMADAMAVATGRACHGSPNRLNLHGPVIQEPTPSEAPASL